MQHDEKYREFSLQRTSVNKGRKNVALNALDVAIFSLFEILSHTIKILEDS